MRIRESKSKAPESKAIVSAFRFMEELIDQVNALRRKIEVHLVSDDKKLKEIGLESRSFTRDADYTNITADWLTRSTLDTFEIVKAKGKKRLFNCAIQVSLAPRDPSADQLFVPHVAILVALSQYSDSWECEEFILDDLFLEREGDDVYAWRLDGELRWVEKDEALWSANVVPLIDLRNEEDVFSRIACKLKDELVCLMKQHGI